MNKLLNNEKGITLIALIITIIILVILAAVSVRAVYNMGIVNHAVNGTQAYTEAAQAEDQMMQDTSSYIDEVVGNIKNPDYSAKIKAFLNSEDGNNAMRNINNRWEFTLSDGTKMYDLGPDLNVIDDGLRYFLYKNGVYKATYTEVSGNSTKIASTKPIIIGPASASFEWNVSKTTIDPSTLGLKGTNLVTVTKALTNSEYTTDTYDGKSEYYFRRPDNGKLIGYDSSAICFAENFPGA